jgi:hypothetical protein
MQQWADYLDALLRDNNNVAVGQFGKSG